MCERVAEARAATLPYFRDVVEAYTLPMPREVLQRPCWHGRPVALGELFVLRKIRREAKAVLFTHQLGWEVQLIIDAQAEGVQTQVCRTQEKVLSTGEQWKAAMGGKGWQ
jgi:hypothetical protein